VLKTCEFVVNRKIVEDSHYLSLFFGVWVAWVMAFFPMEGMAQKTRDLRVESVEGVESVESFEKNCVETYEDEFLSPLVGVNPDGPIINSCFYKDVYRDLGLISEYAYADGRVQLRDELERIFANRKRGVRVGHYEEFLERKEALELAKEQLGKQVKENGWRLWPLTLYSGANSRHIADVGAYLAFREEDMAVALVFRGSQTSMNDKLRRGQAHDWRANLSSKPIRIKKIPQQLRRDQKSSRRLEKIRQRRMEGQLAKIKYYKRKAKKKGLNEKKKNYYKRKKEKAKAKLKWLETKDADNENFFASSHLGLLASPLVGDETQIPVNSRINYNYAMKVLSVFPSLIMAIEDLKEQYPAVVDPRKKKCLKLYFTGHSQGAGLANLAAPLLGSLMSRQLGIASISRKSRLNVYGYSTPRVFDHKEERNQWIFEQVSEDNIINQMAPYDFVKLGDLLLNSVPVGHVVKDQVDHLLLRLRDIEQREMGRSEYKMNKAKVLAGLLHYGTDREIKLGLSGVATYSSDISHIASEEEYNQLLQLSHQKKNHHFHGANLIQRIRKYHQAYQRKKQLNLEK
jgi:hypothetical protein